MREILFRGKSLIIDNWEWVYGYYAPTYLFSKDGENNHTYCIVSDDCIKTHVMLGCGVQSGLPMSYKVKPETVGQYTGLKDKNGKLIFEGDILESPVKRVTQKLRRLIVVTDIRECKFMALYASEYTVIGNIHDNPELLEVKND